LAATLVVAVHLTTTINSAPVNENHGHNPQAASCSASRTFCTTMSRTAHETEQVFTKVVPLNSKQVIGEDHCASVSTMNQHNLHAPPTL